MLESNDRPTELADLGEFKLIEHLTQNLENRQSSTVFAVGDDAAVIGEGEHLQLVSTDMLVEGVHFDLLYTPLKHLGYKAVMVNLSDIYAMNGQAEQITVSIAVSNRMSLEALEDLYEGIKLACEIYNVDLVGGDTTSSTSGLIISITAIGKIQKGKVAYRNGAKENDLICVSGDLGSAYLGLHILEREKQVFNENSAIQPDFSGKDYLLERQLKPEARKDLIDYLDEIGIVPHAMIDLSDGLSSELHHISKASECSCQIYEDKLPIDQVTYQTAMELGLDPTVCALNGGEDYELLFTVPLSAKEKIEAADGISIIGYVADQASGNNLITKAGQAIPLIAQGWRHLQN